jgi:hypothetical protein
MCPNLVQNNAGLLISNQTASTDCKSHDLWRRIQLACGDDNSEIGLGSDISLSMAHSDMTCSSSVLPELFQSQGLRRETFQVFPVNYSQLQINYNKLPFLFEDVKMNLEDTPQSLADTLW